MLQHEGYYKSMMMLTENIHHELNTPLIVIYKKIQKIKQRCINTETCDADFDLIDTSLEGIADLLVRMRPFKDLKKSTSRDLRTLIKTTCDIMNISQHEVFDYEIEYDFMNYKLDTSLLTPGEFTAMMLNFIKNSIDANAHDMKFKIKWVKNESISFYIIDNGNGIPLNVQDSIFKQDSSSKSRNRGNGLYINKFIANESNGDINLKYSDSTGTVFEVVIPIIQNKGKDEK
jgi:signal transduction histidine kinase